jgi:fatty-acyl-CoA synthase
MEATVSPTPWLDHDWTSLTYGRALRQSAQRFPDKIALSGMGRSLTYAQLDRAADELAHGLASLGVGPRDQVALWMTNCPDWVVCWMACARLGAVLVTVNTRFKLEETEYILQQSDAKVLIAMDRFWNIDFLGMIRELAPESAVRSAGQWRSARLPSLRSVVLWESVEAHGCTNLAALRRIGAKALDEGRSLPDTSVDDPVIIVYTSGTTGHPKGAMHSHQILRNAANIARVMHTEPSDVILGHMPLYHVAGAVTACSVMLLLGCTMVTMAQWQTDEALEIIERERVSIFGGIPTHFIDCLDSIRRRPRDVSCLKSAWIGGAPVTPDVALAVREELGLKGLLAVYGMTETTAATSFSSFDDPLDILCDNKGKPIGEFEVAVFDPGTDHVVAAGAVGEVRVRGHIVMLGYYKNPEATAEVIRPDGWFRTGDLGTIDESGYLKITGRLKEMFIVGGSNAYPAEIERLLQGIDEIKQAVVVGVPDRRLGEVGYAFIQVHEGCTIAEAELLARCRAMMADYKVPRFLRFTEDFPRTTTGKIQRFILQRQARESLAQKV